MNAKNILTLQALHNALAPIAENQRRQLCVQLDTPPGSSFIINTIIYITQLTPNQTPVNLIIELTGINKNVC